LGVNSSERAAPGARESRYTQADHDPQAHEGVYHDYR